MQFELYFSPAVAKREEDLEKRKRQFFSAYQNATLNNEQDICANERSYSNGNDSSSFEELPSNLQTHSIEQVRIKPISGSPFQAGYLEAARGVDSRADNLMSIDSDD